MNRHDGNFSGNKAELIYGDGEYHVVRRGTYVICAVSGEQIPLENLRYWHADRQEAYASAAIALQRHQELTGRR